MLRPSKTEIEAVAALLEQGAESPQDMAHAVIQLVERLRGEREMFYTVVGLGPGNYVGEGPYATDHMARKGAVKNIWITEFKRPWGVVSVNSQEFNLRRQKEAADKPPSTRGDWTKVELDKAAFRAGWKGNMKDRAEFLPKESGR